MTILSANPQLPYCVRQTEHSRGCWAAQSCRGTGHRALFAVGAQGPHLSLCTCCLCPVNTFLKDLQFSLLCSSTPVYHGEPSKQTSCTVHLCHMYRAERNQRSCIQIASANAFDLKCYTITRDNGAGTPLTRFNATVAACPAGI